VDAFWNLISREAHQQRNSIWNPIIQVFHSWMFKRIMGRMREMKVTDTELNWLYSALIARQPIDPSYLVINRWCCEVTSGSGDIGSGCYLSMLAISLRPGITRNPDPRLRLFIEGKEYWLEEGILVPAKKNKSGRIIEEGSSSVQEGGAQQNYVPPFGGIPTSPSYYGGPTMQAWESGPAMPPQNYVVPNVTFAEPYTQYPQPQQSMAIIGGYAGRNMQNVTAI
jgi:hypothetical protein